MLQPGIYHAHGERPAPCFGLLTLDVSPQAGPADASAALAAVHAMLSGLPEGRVRDLDGQPAERAAHSAEQFEQLHALVGYGRRLFDPALHRPALTAAPRPDHLAYLPRDGPFPALRWAPHAEPAGEGDVAIQLTAPRRAAVDCAAVEVWKLIEDERLPLQPKGWYVGFGRHDGRGWLDFHDGVSNLDTGQRAKALEAPADPPWMGGGTYMAFLRLRIDLALWRGLERAEQELVIGRDKLTGGGLVGVRHEGGRVVPVAAPVPGDDASDRARTDFAEPPQTAEPLLEASHIHRANQNRASAYAAGGMRMFRQGYDFLDGLGPDGPRLGLNFVSFQRDLSLLTHVLHLPGWLGDVNFGGPAPSSLELITVVAGGLYAVPPSADPFPGAELFAR
jgi:deferrochelatase/peroxidase EfeB